MIRHYLWLHSDIAADLTLPGVASWLRFDIAVDLTLPGAVSWLYIWHRCRCIALLGITPDITAVLALPLRVF